MGRDHASCFRGGEKQCGGVVGTWIRATNFFVSRPRLLSYRHVFCFGIAMPSAACAHKLCAGVSPTAARCAQTLLLCSGQAWQRPAPAESTALTGLSQRPEPARSKCTPRAGCTHPPLLLLLRVVVVIVTHILGGPACAMQAHHGFDACLIMVVRSVRRPLHRLHAQESPLQRDKWVDPARGAFTTAHSESENTRRQNAVKRRFGRGVSRPETTMAGGRCRPPAPRLNTRVAPDRR